jgi:hypothetical protein
MNILKINIIIKIIKNMINILYFFIFKYEYVYSLKCWYFIILTLFIKKYIKIVSINIIIVNVARTKHFIIFQLIIQLVYK